MSVIPLRLPEEGAESIVEPRPRIGRYEDAVNMLRRYAQEAADASHAAYMMASNNGINPLPAAIDSLLSQTIKSAAAARCVRNPYEEREAAE